MKKLVYSLAVLALFTVKPLLAGHDELLKEALDPQTIAAGKAPFDWNKEFNFEDYNSALEAKNLNNELVSTLYKDIDAKGREKAALSSKGGAPYKEATAEYNKLVNYKDLVTRGYYKALKESRHAKDPALDPSAKRPWDFTDELRAHGKAVEKTNNNPYYKYLDGPHRTK